MSEHRPSFYDNCPDEADAKAESEEAAESVDAAKAESEGVAESDVAEATKATSDAEGKARLSTELVRQ